MADRRKAIGPQVLVSSKTMYWSHLTIPAEENILLRHYERFTKRYRECSLDDISSREGSPFVMLRVRTLT